METTLFISMEKAASMLGLGEHTVRSAARAGHLKLIKVGRHHKTTPAAVIAFAEALESGSIQLKVS